MYIHSYCFQVSSITGEYTRNLSIKFIDMYCAAKDSDVDPILNEICTRDFEFYVARMDRRRPHKWSKYVAIYL